jgi:hypothetical protein
MSVIQAGQCGSTFQVSYLCQQGETSASGRGGTTTADVFQRRNMNDLITSASSAVEMLFLPLRLWCSDATAT